MPTEQLPCPRCGASRPFVYVGKDAEGDAIWRCTICGTTVTIEGEGHFERLP